MPLYFHQDLDSDTRLAIWKIEEDEAFFLQQVPLQQHITHPHKRLQHLAGRWLLRRLFPDFPLDLVRIADTRKPFLEDEAYHFSISHSLDLAAAISSRQARVGIDLEHCSPKVARIAPKFSSEEERGEAARGMRAGGEDLPVLTLIWSCKEALFKWYGKGGLDFREHMQVQTVRPLGAERYQVGMIFRKEGEMLLTLQAVFFGDLCLSWIVTGAETGPASI